MKKRGRNYDLYQWINTIIKKTKGHQMELGERLAKLEQKVTDGFSHLNKLFNNHLHSHEEKESFQRRIIVTLIAIIGSFSISMLILLLEHMIK